MNVTVFHNTLDPYSNKTHCRSLKCHILNENRANALDADSWICFHLMISMVRTCYDTVYIFFSKCFSWTYAYSRGHEAFFRTAFEKSRKGAVLRKMWNKYAWVQWFHKNSTYCILRAENVRLRNSFGTKIRYQWLWTHFFCFIQVISQIVSTIIVSILSCSSTWCL
mgnify:FL=1